MLICFVIIVVMNVITYYVKYLDKKDKLAIRTYGVAGLVENPV